MENDSMIPPGNPMLDIDDTRQLLTEIKQIAQQSQHHDMFDFANVLSRLTEIVDPNGRQPHDQPQDDEPLDDQVADMSRFVVEGMEQIRDSVSEEKGDLHRLEVLTRAAVNRWGQYLSDLHDDELDEHFDAEWDYPSDDEEGLNRDSEGEMSAPSEAEVEAILSQLGTGTTSMPTASNESLNAAAISNPASSVPSGPAVHPTPSPSGDDKPSIQDGPSLAPELDDPCELDAELRDAFMDDAGRCLASMEAAILAYESAPGNIDALQQIGRELHTMKGASASVGLSQLADYLHQIEDSLRTSEASGNPPETSALFEYLDTISTQVDRIGAHSKGSSPEAESSIPKSPDTGTVSSAPALSTFSDGPTDDETVRVKASQLNRLMDMLAELVMLRNRNHTELAVLQSIHREMIHSVSRLRQLSDGDDENQVDAHRESEGRNHRSTRYLTEVANDMLEVAQRLRDCYQPVTEGNLAVSRFIRQFRQELVELRRTPITGLFRRLRRVIRDAAQAEGKQVHLTLFGEEVGIERSLQERLYEPLLHIVRNAVAHGIESYEERIKHGKDPVGQVTLEAHSGPDLLVVEIRDDGRGLNYDALRRRGIERGLISAEKAASREELSQLIFHPGFSTQENASQVSGRGVGMDVVAATLERMRGWVEVESEPDQGTVIRLSFPLPSVIQHTMVFRSGGQLFALPMQFIQGAGSRQGDVLAVPFSRLMDDGQRSNDADSQMLVLACEAPSLVAPDGRSRRVALLVDEIIGPEEVVVRPMPSLLKHHPVCAGATLSGMGDVVLVLDAHRLVELSVHCEADRSDIFSCHSTARLDGRERNGGKVLVVDDSLSARKRVVRSLERHQIETVEASDGAEAMEWLKAESFVAVFTDLEMPRLNGLELLSEIHDGRCGQRPPVVMVSSRDEDEFRQRAADLGVTTFLAKPMTDEALDSVLEMIPTLKSISTMGIADLSCN